MDGPSMRDERIKALVLLDPLAFVFDVKGLASLQAPMLLFRPENDDYLSSKGNALALAAALPHQPEQIVVPGSHFVFIDPCPEEIAKVAAAQCQDAPGIDRAAIHRRMESDIAHWLARNL